VGTARVQEALGQAEEAEAAWRAVLAADASNVEAVASLAAQHFYGGQPEVALRLYRRWAGGGGRGAGLGCADVDRCSDGDGYSRCAGAGRCMCQDAG
jgi:tetratricopeptide repeat protein 8